MSYPADKTASLFLLKAHGWYIYVSCRRPIDFTPIDDLFPSSRFPQAKHSIPLKLKMDFEHGPYRGPTVLAVLWALECLSLVVVLLRVYCKRCISRACGWDDGVICVSLVSSSTLLSQANTIDHYAAQALHLAAGGLYTRSVTMGVAGRHIDELKEPSRTIEGMVLFAIAQTVGTVCLSLSKTSFAISLIRISPCQNMKCFLCFLIFTLNFVMLGCSSIYLLQCQPIGAIWDVSLRPTATCWPQSLVTGLASTSHSTNLRSTLLVGRNADKV